MIIITFGNTVLDATIMHHVISCHWSVHGIASSSGIYKLTTGYAFKYNFGLSSVPILSLLALLGFHS